MNGLGKSELRKEMYRSAWHIALPREVAIIGIIALVLFIIVLVVTVFVIRLKLKNRTHLYYESAPEAISPASKHIDIPVYFLTNHRTLSWGETVMMLVKGYGLGTIIGTNTCGTNGDATQLNVPAFMFGMTALKAVNRDGSRHHGIGVVPDIYMEDIDLESCVKLIR